MARPKRRIDRDALERWRDKWSTADRVMVLAALDAVPGGVCLASPDNTHVAIYANGQAKGTRAAVINPGYIQWPGRKAADIPTSVFPEVHETSGWGAWTPLSTFRPNEAGPGRHEAELSLCPTCFVALPATGRCDNCN